LVKFLNKSSVEFRHTFYTVHVQNATVTENEYDTTANQTSKINFTTYLST